MSRTVIHVAGLGKRYRIGQAKQHNALRHVIGDALGAPLRLLSGNSNVSSANSNGKNLKGGSPYIWALNFARLRSVFGKAQPKVPSAFFQRRSVAKRELPSS